VAGVITVGIIDDDRLLVQMMRTCIAQVPDIQLAHSAETVDEYLELRPADQVVLLDLNLRDSSAPANNVARLIELGSKVLVLSIIPDTKYVIATLEAGAAGYLTKKRSLDEIVTAIRDVAAGRLKPSHDLAFAVTRDKRSTRPRLSRQEHRLFVYYARGMTLAAAARRIGVKTRTAEDYLNRVKKKYEDAGRPARTKLELAERLHEDGIDDTPEL
jgi:DNA-binding NarL/FixJ family response regulator